jgi:hypothetical protein
MDCQLTSEWNGCCCSCFHQLRKSDCACGSCQEAHADLPKFICTIFQKDGVYTHCDQSGHGFCEGYINRNKLASEETKTYESQNNFRIFKEKPGVISINECWCCISEGYLYTADTLEDLLVMLNSEWKHENHIVG